jgi:hypothetical protein
MGTSPLCPTEGRRRGGQTSRKACPDRLESAQARGLNIWLGGSTYGYTSWTYPNAGKCRYVHMAPPWLAEIPPRPVATNTSHTRSTLWKNLAVVHALLQGFGGYTRGCASAPPRNDTTTRREEGPIRKHQPLRVPTDTTAKARSLLLVTTIRVP